MQGSIFALLRTVMDDHRPAHERVEAGIALSRRLSAKIGEIMREDKERMRFRFAREADEYADRKVGRA